MPTNVERTPYAAFFSIYSRLILEFPEKSAYFATLIDSLEPEEGMDLK